MAALRDSLRNCACARANCHAYSRANCRSSAAAECAQLRMSIAIAVALILKDGCVLMGERRADKGYPLHWEFPGGKLEFGEMDFDALRRELKEELSIEV